VQQAEASARIDTRLYRHRIGAIMSAPARFTPPDATIDEALREMARARISALLVASNDGSAFAGQVGIVTERDVMRALSEHGASALSMPVERIASRPLVTVKAQALAYIAIGRMNRLKIRHLGVIDETGAVVGVLSARDLLRLRAPAGGELGDEIEQARDVQELGLAWSRLTSVTRGLVREGLPGRQVAAVISHQLGELTRRAVALAEQSMIEDGAGPAPRRFSFLVLGSAGRGESLLAMDQDNALVYDGEERPDIDRWFEMLAVRVADTLHAVGVPYCKGGVMAKNSQWRGSLNVWRGRIQNWIGRSSPHDLLAVDIFFDLLGIAGDASIAENLRREAFDAAKGQAGFAKLLAAAEEGRPSPFGWWGGLALEQGRIDLKKHGLFPIVSAARALAICRHVSERSTPARLLGVKSLELGMEADLDALDEAHALFVELVLRQQLEDAGHGRSLDNTVEVGLLTPRERGRLRSALRSVRYVDDMVRDLLFRT
jgi:DNA polymerase-3 subunit epsilon/CBS domain-containing protein